MTDERTDQPFSLIGRLCPASYRKGCRKLRAQKNGEQTVWFGLGMSGLIGWSVAVPTVAGAMAGLWWDNHHPGTHSWTLMLLTIGLCVGCANAWHWVDQENKAIQDGAMGQEDKHE
jgi:ATP synthase protein I